LIDAFEGGVAREDPVHFIAFPVSQFAVKIGRAAKQVAHALLPGKGFHRAERPQDARAILVVKRHGRNRKGGGRPACVKKKYRIVVREEDAFRRIVRDPSKRRAVAGKYRAVLARDCGECQRDRSGVEPSAREY